MRTPKENTLAMLVHYMGLVLRDEISPEMILVHDGGAATWAGMSRERMFELFQQEIDRQKLFASV